MRILAVDDKEMPRRVLVRAIREADPEADVTACSNALEALELPDLETFDVAFVDIDMPGKNGIELARDLKRVNARINIIFATGYGEYMADAFALHSSGYLMKPITAKDVAAELKNLRFPLTTPEGVAGLFVRCFGDFEVFADGKAVSFDRAKTKELFAYLVDRREAVVSTREIESVLWSESERSGRASSSYLRTLVSDLKRTLEACGYPNVLVKRYGAVGIVAQELSCDYYDFLKGDPIALSAWHGEYMSQYPWAEATRTSILS